MFERFTERARQVVVLTQDEARALKHNYIGTEHLLLGVQDWELAAMLRDLERSLVTESHGERRAQRRAERAVALPPPEQDRAPIVAALVVAAAGFPLGLLVGWAIWG